MNPYFDIVLRTSGVYLFIIVAIRLFGKSELTQLSVVDLVFILLISNSVQNAMVGSDSSLIGGLMAAASLFVINFLIKRTTYFSPAINKLLQGEPVMLIHDGVILKEHLNKVHLTVEELEAAIREHGVSDVSKVDLAVLETDGNISIISENYQKRSQHRRKSHKIVRKEG
jgi:uncharacterized membrane protein YcaP (DUF421 family)